MRVLCLMRCKCYIRCVWKFTADSTKAEFSDFNLALRGLSGSGLSILYIIDQLCPGAGGAAGSPSRPPAGRVRRSLKMLGL